MSKGPLAVLALVGVGAWIVKSQAPELQRYMRVRRM
jgi:Family of unknown function (DUF6893)